MTPENSERAFEDAIECALLDYGPEACPDAMRPRCASRRPPMATTSPVATANARPATTTSGFASSRRTSSTSSSLPSPKEWEKLEQHHGADLQDRFLKPYLTQIGRRGALDVLRNGIKDFWVSRHPAGTEVA